MKKSITMLVGLAFATGVCAQTDVLVGVMQGKGYGVTYLLPKTEIEIAVRATKHTYVPGEFCKYADRYLRMGNVADNPDTHWTVDGVSIRVVGVPDKDKVYFVKMKDKSVAPLMELTENGIVRSINVPINSSKAKEVIPATALEPATEVDPRKFLTEEVLMAGSRAKMAELVAKEIYSIRESKNALLRGEADNMPQDGAQLKIMLDNLNIQERAMVQMFSGTRSEETHTSFVRIVPQELENAVAFRFSRKLGLVDKDDLSGEPYYISITNLETPAIPADDGKKKKEEGVAYNVPGQARVILANARGEEIFKGELPVTQFGTTEYLAPVLFNKKSTIQVRFDTATGGLLKVDRN